MRIDGVFVLQDVLDDHIVVPVGDTADRLRGVIRLNDTGAFLWRAMNDSSLCRQELIDLVVCEYLVTEERAGNDVDSFIAQLRSVGVLG